MSTVEVKLPTASWSLVAAGAILAAAKYLMPAIPTWAVVVPFVLVFIEGIALLPSLVVTAWAGATAMRERAREMGKEAR